MKDYRIRNDVRSMLDIAKRVNSNRYTLGATDLSTGQRSNVVESVLMRLPLQPVYLLEHKDGTSEFVGNTSAISAVVSYMNNEFYLTVNNELFGLTFSELPPMLQRRLENTEVVLRLVDYSHENEIDEIVSRTCEL